jgi:SSS family solute:Na+ symporter
MWPPIRMRAGSRWLRLWEGPPLLALAGAVVFAASMGNIDATVQSIGAQTANDVAGPLSGALRAPLSESALMVTSQTVMAIVTRVSAAIARMPLLALFTIGLFATQIMVQLSVPLCLGIFTKRGNSQSAIAGILAGVATAVCFSSPGRSGFPGPSV